MDEEPQQDRNSHIRPRIRRAEEFAKQFKFAEAIGEYDFIIAHGVDLPPDFIAQRGYLKYRSLDFAGCIADCSVALESNPELAQALFNRAAANKELRNPHAALADLERLLALKPDHEQALYHRAYLLGDTEQWERSIPAWEPYMAVRPDDWKPYLFRGIAYAATDRKREAIREYLLGNEVDPKAKSLYFRRWMLFRELGEPELAQKEFEAGNAILNDPEEDPPARDPRDPHVRYNQEKIEKLMRDSRTQSEND